MKIFPIHKQRVLVFLAAICGAGTLFLPWIRISLFGFSKVENGLHGIGILVFSLLVVTGLLALVGDKSRPMDPLIGGINQVSASGALAGILIFFYKAGSSVVGLSEIRYGIYLGGLAALTALLASVLLRRKGTKPPARPH